MKTYDYMKIFYKPMGWQVFCKSVQYQDYKTNSSKSGRFKQVLGFTLLELLITVSLVAILTMIAYPTYTSFVTRTRRIACQNELVNFSQAAEQFYTLNNTYVGIGSGSGYSAPVSSVYVSECPFDSSPKYYDFTISTPTSNTYTLRATPKGAQAGNGFLELTSIGGRGWDKDNDGATAEASWDDR